MITTADSIFERRSDPEGLEELYRQDPQAFRDSFDGAFQSDPDAMAFRVWRARLTDRASVSDASAFAGSGRGLLYTIGLGLAVGAFVRVPAFWLVGEWYYPRFALLWVVLSLAAYFLIRRPDRALMLGGLGLAVVAGSYASFLPGETDSVVMALVHLPLVAWVYLGLTFTL